MNNLRAALQRPQIVHALLAGGWLLTAGWLAGRASGAGLPAAQLIWPGLAVLVVLSLVGLGVCRRASRAHGHQLEELEQRYAALFQFNPQPAFVLDTAGRYRAVNPAGLALTGYRADEVLGRPFADFLSQREAQRLAGHFAAALGGEPRQFEARFRCRDGAYIDLQCSSVPLVVGGRVIGVGGACHDLTAERAQARRLRLSEERYRAVLAHTPLAVYAIDRQGRLSAVNAAGWTITGYTAEEVERLRFVDLVVEEDLAAAEQAFAAALAGQAQHLRLRVRHRDGGTRTVAVSAAPLRLDEPAQEVAVLVEDVTARLATEQRLRESEQRLRALFDSSIDGILLLDGEGRVVDANRAAARALYRGQRELIGLQAWEDIAADPPGEAQWVRESFIRHGRFRGERIYRRGDGSRFPVDVSATRFRDGQGRTWASVLFKDISRRRSAEVRRRELEEVLEATSDVVALLRPDGRITYLNAAGRDLLGLPERSAEPLTWERLVPQDGYDPQIFVRAGEAGLWQGEGALRGASGTPIPVSLVVMRQGGGPGEQRRYAVIARDISSAKRLETALRESEARYRSLIDTAEEGVWMLDAADHNALVNPALTRMLGYSAEQMLGRSVYEFIPEAGHSATREQLQLRRAGLSDQFDWSLQRKDGSTLWVMVSASPVYDQRGRYRGVLSLLTDISERKAMELRLEHSRAELQRLSAFLSSVREQEQKRISRELHDELGQRLTAQRLDLDWLQRHCAAAAPALLEPLQGMQQRLDETVAAVRELAASLRPRVLDDLGLTAACEWLVDRMAARGELQVELVSEPEEHELPEPVATAVYRLIQEALTNVVRHAGARRARVRLIRTGDRLRCSVEDDGRGPPEGFDARGTFGVLGMRERIHSVGGWLEIRPRPEGGTRVLAEIPLSSEANDEEH